MKNTTQTLRRELFKQMEDVKSGKRSIEEAKAISKISSSIIHTIQVEVDNKKIEARLMKSMCRDEINKKITSLTSIEL